MSGAQEEENAAELKIPEIFLKANALSNTEAKIVVEHHLNAREIRLDHASDRVRKTYEYLSQFSVQQNRSNMDALRDWKPRYRKLASSFPSITDFEVCALANLAPGDAEEAKLMIPSLAGKLSDEDLNQVAEEIATYR